MESTRAFRKSLMKNILLASVALFSMIGQAEAQEAGYNWSGFYVGAQAGYGWSSAEFSGTSAVPQGDHEEDGFVGGIYVGRDWQQGRWVFGVLADVDYIDVDQIELSGFRDTIFGPKAENYQYDIDWLATARVRAGFLPTDRLLVYGTGGLAATHVSASGFQDGFPFDDTFKNSGVEIGGVFGLGAEFALTRNWSLKTEYLHYDFNTLVADPAEGGPSFDPSVDTVKIGLSFRLGP
jgi:outer membrane immunogenic protein